MSAPGRTAGTRQGLRRPVPAQRTTTIGIAVPVPEPYATELTRWRCEFGDPLADRIPPHVTLLPPTELRTGQLGRVRAHLRAVAAGGEPFEMHLRGTATFRPVSPVVFVQLVRGISQCELLEAAVRGGPLARDIAFPYHPHVTVAHDVEEPALDRAEETLRDWEASFPVTGFSLYEHGGDGVWRPQEEFRFPAALAG
ncbi:2'-5' RNA ligase family protein [Kineococcus glutinatus]|uniref:2'-5' RNA ligase family protein n=1 Tax=Kineococcus glutinatus TaxID=1070872 RepID=A0ABP9HRT4_9ACTN